MRRIPWRAILLAVVMLCVLGVFTSHASTSAIVHWTHLRAQPPATALRAAQRPAPWAALETGSPASSAAAPAAAQEAETWAAIEAGSKANSAQSRSLSAHEQWHTTSTEDAYEAATNTATNTQHLWDLHRARWNSTSYTYTSTSTYTYTNPSFSFPGH